MAFDGDKYKKENDIADIGEEWIGVDLDGTLAILDEKVSPTHIGMPIPPMVRRVQQWHKEGKRVKIFTARVSVGFTQALGLMKSRGVIPAIKVWCQKNLGFVPEITADKDHLMVELWDDINLINVERNTGHVSWDDYIKFERDEVALEKTMKKELKKTEVKRK